MRCPHCSGDDTRVVDTRAAGEGIRRRRQCQQCGRRFTTYERVAPELILIKRDGRRESWDRQKVLNGIRIACTKRPVAMADMERLVDQVEEYVMSLGRAEVSTRVVGEKVLEGLKALDPVAYIRFASVYLDLPDLHALRAEIDRLLEGH
ncbi:MAG: transcriptional regulator NrdR [Anaerolineae bacterium]|nr:transcriptional regulator NrdR [Anaerolineae bacterium]MDW8100955.1 transcriptional regulator NrdR [Anaerolineae bacterium]